MLTDANRATALQLLRETNLLPQVLPEINNLPPAAFDETTRILAALQDPSLSLALAALLIQVQGLEAVNDSSPLVPTIARRLKYTNKEIERAAWLLDHLPSVSRAAQLPWPQLQRILVHDGAAELVALHEAIAGPADPALAFCRERLAWPPERTQPAPLLTGGDLINHGLRPGPHFTALLDTVRDAQLNGEINSRAEALALVDRLL